MPDRSLTGDPLTDSLLPVGLRLVGAVRDGDRDAVDAAFRAAESAVGDLVDDPGPSLPGEALAVVVAALVPLDQAPTALLGWLQEDIEFRRLTDAGVGEQMARFLAATVTERGTDSGVGSN